MDAFEVARHIFNLPALFHADLLACDTTAWTSTFCCVQLIYMHDDRKIFKTSQSTSPLTSSDLPQFSFWLCVRRDICWMNRLVLQSFAELQQHLCQIAVAAKPVGTRPIVSLAIAL